MDRIDRLLFVVAMAVYLALLMAALALMLVVR
jgi:hypothetical protein